MLPELGPESVDGVFGELFGVLIVTVFKLDHPEDAPLLSIAFAFT